MSFIAPLPNPEHQKTRAIDEFFSQMANIRIEGAFTLTAAHSAGYALAIAVFKENKDVLGIKVPVIHRAEEKIAFFERRKWEEHIVETEKSSELFSPSLSEEQYLSQ